MKACFVSSSGGHWEELMCFREIADENETFYVTEEGGQAAYSGLERIYVIPQINRHERFFIVHFICLLIKAARIMFKEKPDFTITTGSLAAFPFCVMGKLRGTKIIYIESFARIYNASLTGRLIYPFADLFLVQWKSLLKVYPKAVYVGCIF